MHQLNLLTLILLKPKVISYYHQHRTRPAFTSQAHQLHVLILISLKLLMDGSKNIMWIIPFKKFSRLMVKQTCPPSFLYSSFKNFIFMYVTLYSQNFEKSRRQNSSFHHKISLPNLLVHCNHIFFRKQITLIQTGSTDQPT